MSYLRDNNSLTPRKDGGQDVKKKILTVSLVVVLIYSFLFTGIFSAFSSALNFIMTPVWEIKEYVSDTGNSFSAGFYSKKSLILENRRLEEELDIARFKLLDRNLLFEENLELKEFLGRGVTGHTVFATVLVKPNRSLYDTFIIDVGDNAGIKNGNRVMYGGNVVIGKIVEVFSRTSKVLLLSSPGEFIDVVVGDDNIATVAYGRSSGNFELELPRDTNVQKGDMVVIPNIVPYVLGKVEHVESNSSNPFKKIFFKNPVNIFKIKWVEVIID